jgi:hypothetical protein
MAEWGYFGSVRINWTIMSRTSLFLTCFLCINWWFPFAARYTCHIAIGWSLRYIINWQHYLIILLNCCNICLYFFLVLSSSLRSSYWRCIMCKIFNVYMLVIKWFVYNRNFARVVASTDSVFICIIFICFMFLYLYLVRLPISVNFYSNLSFIHIFVF